jgi:hypothetical protein
MGKLVIQFGKDENRPVRVSFRSFYKITLEMTSFSGN